MKCVACKHGETENGHTTVTLERGSATIVIKHVPAEVCTNCGEAYLMDETVQRLEQLAEGVLAQGGGVLIQEYKAA